jgi:hypothetical protein
MMVILLGALLVFGGVLYMVRAVIWRGSLSGPDSGRPVRGTWSRDGAAWDSWGSEQTGRAFSS